MSEYKVVYLADNKEVFEKEMNGWNELARHSVHLNSLQKYYSQVLRDRFCQQSFLIKDKSSVVALVRCDLTDGILGRYRFPLDIQIPASNSDAQYKKLVKIIFRELSVLFDKYNAEKMLVRDEIKQDGLLSVIGLKCFESGASSELSYSAVVDLNMDEAQIWTDVRKRYKSYINWGKKNLKSVYINRDNVNESLYWDFWSFHKIISGRETRPKRSWELSLDRIASGQGEVILGYLDDELVSGVYTRFSGTHAYYGTGVFDREKFDKPISHWPIYDSIIRSRDYGCQYYDIGNFYTPGVVSDKEYSIGYFKKGFTSRYEISLIWTLTNK